MRIIVALLGLILPAAAFAQPADLLVENANIYVRGDGKTPQRWLAVRGGKVLAAGADPITIAQYRGPNTRIIDARGATVVPGFIDSHCHMRGLGQLLESRDLRHVASVAGIAAYIAEQAKSRKPGEWIVARNWDQTNWGGAFPHARDLDRAAPANPVFLSRVDGHAAWVNSAALRAAGVTAKTQDPPGGKIIRTANPAGSGSAGATSGEPTGVFIDAAMSLVRSKIPPATDEQVKRQLELAARECARLGLTSVHDAGVGKQELAAYRALIAEGKLPVRVYAMIGGPGELWREMLVSGPVTGDQLTVRSIKMFADGALGSRGAALWQPYSDDKGNSGLLLSSRETLEQVARDAAAKGFQVCTHAIGDRANRLVLDAYAAALGGRNDKRFRIEHAQVVSLPDFQLFADNSVIAAIQSTHATSDMRWAEQRLGPDRIAGAYAWRRFLQLGVPAANGSDFPVEEPNPLFGFYSAITRQDRDGKPPEGWTPSQKMTRAEALHSWTLAGAFAAFEEGSKGSLDKGKLADFIVLSQDIMTVPPSEILKTKVRLTVLGGRVVYEEPIALLDQIESVGPNKARTLDLPVGAQASGLFARFEVLAGETGVRLTLQRLGAPDRTVVSTLYEREGGFYTTLEPGAAYRLILDNARSARDVAQVHLRVTTTTEGELPPGVRHPHSLRAQVIVWSSSLLFLVVLAWGGDRVRRALLRRRPLEDGWERGAF